MHCIDDLDSIHSSLHLVGKRVRGGICRRQNDEGGMREREEESEDNQSRLESSSSDIP